MTNDAIDPAGDQRMPALDGDEPAEPAAEHEHRPDPQRTTGGEENHAKPPNGISVEGPHIGAVRVGRQIGEQQPDHPKGRAHPAVPTVLALAGTEISAAEQRNAHQREANDRKGNQGGVGEEGRKAAPAEDREPEIGKACHYGDECRFGRGRHGGLACMIAFYASAGSGEMATANAVQTLPPCGSCRMTPRTGSWSDAARDDSSLAPVL